MSGLSRSDTFLCHKSYGIHVLAINTICFSTESVFLRIKHMQNLYFCVIHTQSLYFSFDKRGWFPHDDGKPSDKESSDVVKPYDDLFSALTSVSNTMSESLQDVRSVMQNIGLEAVDKYKGMMQKMSKLRVLCLVRSLFLSAFLKYP